MIANKCMLATTLLFLFSTLTYGQSSVFKYDLSLGMGRGDTKKTLENAGFEIVDDKRINKQMRSFVVNGFVYSSITEPEDTKRSTEFDFYNNKLMNTTLFVKSKDYFANKEITDMYLKELTDKYGKHVAYENVMNIKSWKWDSGNTKVLLNSDGRKKTAKISFIYLPLYSKKYEDEMKVKIKGRGFDPVDDMLIR